METDIESQSKIIEALVKKYIKNYCILLDLPLLIKRIVLVASGSSYNAALISKYFFKNIAKTPASVEYASEFINETDENYEFDTLYIFISQSGSSADTLEALKMVKNNGGKTLCVTNNPDSPMDEIADYKFNIEAGPEGAIAATKTFSASVFMTWLMACKIAQNKHININKETRNIYSISKNIEETIDKIDNLETAAKFLSKQRDFSTFGYGINYPIAREAALKIKETSYINISSYPTGEFIHGHFAILNKSKVFLTYIMRDHKEREIKLLNKILSKYRTKSVVISDVYEDYNCDCLIKIPPCESKIGSILNLIVTIQLLAYKIASILKRDIDKPKGLTKVVDN